MRTKCLPNVTILAFVMAVSFLFAEGSIAGEEKILMMATTTSTDNTGLLDYLAPKFREETGVELRWTATGTGKALKLGENCDVDVLLVHAPEAELKFIETKFGIERREVMFNDFVIIGPPQDPAGIRGKSVKDAFAALKAKQGRFVSRGDKSGTHQKEIELWTAAGIKVPEKEKWYVQTGQGMLSTIHITAEQTGYTLTDRGTYIKYEHDFKGKAPLTISVEGDADLMNQYSVMAVNPAHCPSVKKDMALQWIRWITSAGTQQAIADFKILGKSLFVPNAKSPFRDK